MNSTKPKGLLSVVIGNTPDARGAVVNHAMRLSPRAVVLAVSIHNTTGEEYPTVQRFVSGNDPRLHETAPLSATGDPAIRRSGDPAIILRQDPLSLKRPAGKPHVILALPTELDALPFLVELWRERIGSSSLGDHYEGAPIL
ncbi:hypothetical protein [Streptomyces decoyicus]